MAPRHEEYDYLTPKHIFLLGKERTIVRSRRGGAGDTVPQEIQLVSKTAISLRKRWGRGTVGRLYAKRILVVWYSDPCCHGGEALYGHVILLVADIFLASMSRGNVVLVSPC